MALLLFGVSGDSLNYFYICEKCWQTSIFTYEIAKAEPCPFCASKNDNALQIFRQKTKED